ncbi:MAG: ABC transporter substrate-binding protein [Deinococcota bacterium]
MKKAFVLLVLTILGFTYAQETRTVTDDLGRTVEVPINPQRIISGDDNTIGMPLADFGVPFIGAQARVAEDGSLFMRGLGTVYGITFEGSDITPVSTWWEFDLEKVAELEPDLIILIEWQQEQAEQFELIAPTYFVLEVPDPWAVQASIARALGLEDEFEQRRAIYQEEVALLREELQIPEGTTYALLSAGEDGIWVSVGAYNFTTVLSDLGFVPNALTQELIDEGVVWAEQRSAEILPELDADVIFMGYNASAGFGPQDVIARMDALLPGWCGFLPACASGNIIFYPQSSMSAPTFDATNAALDIVGSHFASRLLTSE